ncbi:hypothetical protein Poly30_28670 [Planctomycetes bacterium Poly30]|uniref:Uncharacterized protein n=1 Tax=Saltatorellus ferox TaxID=2528018 RepID=A0A518ETD9_9BACT|nr:hypothetical protein Poly30_28670 [Planctomycetes bacterium Poly30]
MIPITPMPGKGSSAKSCLPPLVGSRSDVQDAPRFDGHLALFAGTCTARRIGVSDDLWSRVRVANYTTCQLP